jgi:hypothetical protein
MNMTAIPRGVVDDARLAVVRNREGQIIALDPVTGEVRWRHGQGLRPCAITHGLVLAVAIAGESGADAPQLTLVALAEDDGRELWRTHVADLPAWARPGLDDTADFALSADVTGDGIVLRWVVRSGYQGGAAADPERVAAQTREVVGAAEVDLSSRIARPVAEVPRSAPPHAEKVRTASGPPVGRDVVDYADTPSQRMELAVVDGGPQTSSDVVLRGVDPVSGDRRWEVVLDPAACGGPAPLRP